MRKLGFKIATLMFCLPALAFGAGPRKAGAARANLVKGRTSAEVQTALVGANLTGVDSTKVTKALDKGIVEASDLNTLINNDSGKLESSLRENVIKLVAAEADYTGLEVIPGERVMLDGARKKIMRLAVEIDDGSTHNQGSLNDLAAVMSDSYSSQKLPSETVAALGDALEKTATKEAKDEAERTGKSLLELFADCN